MDRVDYLKLAEQYANFLVAVGGVSITALTLVLSLSGKSKDKMRPARRASRAFLVGALSVSTVCCFIGAQMMAETAAFISYIQDKNLVQLSGERPFLLASTNIFMAAVLVLFALMLLPTVSGEKQAASLATISASVFALIVFGAICWMFRAGSSRMHAPSGWPVIIGAVAGSILWGGLLYYFIKSRKSRKFLLTATFIPIIFFTVVSLLMFAWTFGAGDKSHDLDIFFFTFAVTFSYISLIIISFKIMLDNNAEAAERRRIKAEAAERRRIMTRE